MSEQKGDREKEITESRGGGCRCLYHAKSSVHLHSRPHRSHQADNTTERLERCGTTKQLPRHPFQISYAVEDVVESRPWRLALSRSATTKTRPEKEDGGTTISMTSTASSSRPPSSGISSPSTRVSPVLLMQMLGRKFLTASNVEIVSISLSVAYRYRGRFELRSRPICKKTGSRL